jgi:hypothetical protein
MKDEVNAVVPDEAFTGTDVDVECQLSEEIARLWSTHQSSKRVAKRSRQELKTLRTNLSQRLHQMKALLVRTGRSGGWAAYLRSHGLPRATADRYVRDRDAVLNPRSKNRLTEALPEPTEQDIRSFIQRAFPRLRRLLSTPVGFYQLVYWMVMEVPGADAEIDDDGVIMLKPSKEVLAAHKQGAELSTSLSVGS